MKSNISKTNTVRNYILELLEKGAIGPGDKIPGARQIASTLGISLLTVQIAIASMAKEGILRLASRQGTFISENVHDRILQNNFSGYISWDEIPWSGEFRSRISGKLSQLHFTHFWKKSIFEIRTTPDVWVDRGQFVDLKPFFDRLYPDKSDFFEQPLATYSRDGAIYGIPLLFSPRVMFVNNAIFREAQVEIPQADWNWDEFFTVIAELLQKLPAEKVFSWHLSPYLWLNFVFACGGSIIDPTAADPIRFDTPQSRRGLKIFQKLGKMLGAGTNFVRHNFVNNNVALAIEPRQTVGRLKQNNIDDYTVLPIPTDDGVPSATIQATEIFCVRKGCADMETAALLLETLLSQDFQDYLAELKYAIPLRKSSAAKTFAITSARDAVFRDGIANIRSRYHFDERELYSLIPQSIGKLLVSADDLDSALKEFADNLRNISKIVYS